MKIKLAECEKRNFGIVAYEIMIEAGDTITEFQEEISKLKDCEYLAVKTPVNSKEFLWGMHEMGMTYIETQIILELKKKNYAPPQYLARFERDVSLKPADTQEAIERVKKNILNDMFQTDRFALDCIFTGQGASNRYKNWTGDLLESGSYIIEMYIKDNPAGFFICDNSETKVGRTWLVGMYKEYEGKGFGTILSKKSCDYLFEKGYASVIGGVSSNNMNIINTDISLGFEIKEMLYTYVKHMQFKSLVI